MATPQRRPRPTEAIIPQMTLGDRMVLARKSADLKQAHFVALLRKSRFSITAWEHDGHEPDRGTLLLWAAECGVDIDWLADGIYPEGFDVDSWSMPAPQPQRNVRRGAAERRRQGLRSDEQVIDLRDAERKSAAVEAAKMAA
jgi:transcriptional regulator with XRE-family HTH domain